MPEAHSIEVRGLEKAFRIPNERVNTLKERALHPFRRRRFDEHNVLRNIEFDIYEGEFFGIVGRNGSGKSTLLKCLAGIYAVDRGSIRVAGRLAPFIELGVGFNPDLTARDNVVLNAVMMGLSPTEARRRFDEIIEFAGLEEFVDLKLKNYSSGMQVRLAFSVMVQSEADVYLIDEVLAVGDAAFQQRCFDVFFRLRDEGKTIVLVTHAMDLAQRFCHRALLIRDGRIEQVGDPGEVGRKYLAENFRDRHAITREDGDAPAIQLLDLRASGAFENPDTDAIAHGEPLRLHAEFEAHEDIESPSVVLWIENEERTRVFSFGATDESGRLADLAAGERVVVDAQIDNPLTGGRYFVGCSVTRGSAGAEIALYLDRATDFIVYGGENVNGLVYLRSDVHVERTQQKVIVR